MHNNLISSPPNLPAYLRDIYDLKPIFGTPSDDEVMGIHAVIQMAQKAVDVPGTGDPLLLAKLAEHLFNIQMAKYRINYLTATFPEPIVDAPSDEDIVKVQNAIRTYNQLVNISSMFDPRINMELSQQLFDIQMAKYTQRTRQSRAALVWAGIPSSSPTTIFKRTSDEAQEEPTTNNSGTGANNNLASGQSIQTLSDPAVREYLQTSNRLAEQANQLVERSNLLIERLNQLGERANELAERSKQPAETNILVEKVTELFGRLNDHFEESNRIAKSHTQPVENLGDILKNINRVLVGIQHARVFGLNVGLDNSYLEPQGQYSQGSGLFGKRKRGDAWAK
ncbi:unnamed protein product [Rhizoctonia solani]|uniref:Laminin domain protein n=1 Tax=Rhizoctonia solani TaxID=456999 RepID=A0A8H2WG38_9AGAM|nr:unnamed protein product [Rhizoctonia solani]